MRHTIRLTAPAAVVLAAALLLAPPAGAAVDGIDLTGANPAIILYAKAGYVTSADGASILMWGLTSNPAGPPQYPSPTLIVDQGATVTITVNNQLTFNSTYPGSTNTSLVFPGHDVTSCTGLAGGLLTCEAAAGGGMASYTFVAEQAGTYLYHSGTDAAIQVEMGILGAIVVRPYGFDSTNPTAYGHPDTAYDREYLFVLSEMDSRIHQMVEFGDAFTGTELLGDFFSNYWFINGRTGPDTMMGRNLSWLPTQPYGSLAQMHPGEKVLTRVVSAGRDLHPFHVHGDHADVIARNGRLLSSTPGGGVDLRSEVFTIQAVPGETYDGIWEWTGEKMGWDMYGILQGGMPDHECNGIALSACETPNPNDENPACQSPGYDPITHEYCGDHGLPFRVALPQNQDLAFGGFWSGSPYMGAAGALPPGEGGLNPNSGYTFMWHSHTEKELTNNDIFPGGMMTMIIVQPPGTTIVE